MGLFGKSKIPTNLPVNLPGGIQNVMDPKGAVDVAARKILKGYEFWLRIFVRGPQLLLDFLAFIIFFTGIDRNATDYAPLSSAWGFAMFVTGASMATVIVYFPINTFWSPKWRWTWDALLGLFHLILFLVFHFIFKDKKSGDVFEGARVTSVFTARVIALLAMFVWIFTASYGAFRQFMFSKLLKIVDKLLGCFLPCIKNRIKAKYPNYENHMGKAQQFAQAVSNGGIPLQNVQNWQQGPPRRQESFPMYSSHVSRGFQHQSDEEAGFDSRRGPAPPAPARPRDQVRGNTHYDGDAFDKEYEARMRR